MGWFVVVVHGLLIALLSLPPGATAAQATPEGSVPVALRHTIEIADGMPLALSPDGTQLAAWRDTGTGRALCVLDAATLDELVCGAVPKEPIAASSVTWSPQGTHLAFTEDALPRSIDSDIWVLDLGTGTVTNLTDDGQAGMRVGQAADAPTDLAPAFSPDGTELVFARGTTTPADATALMTVPLTGGQPRRLVSVSSFPFAIPGGVRWLPDGTILYAVGSPRPDEQNGLWALDTPESEPRQLADAGVLGLGTPILVDVSTRGQAVLMSPEREGVAFALVDLDSNAVTPVTPHPQMLSTIDAAAFSPDGTQFLLSYGFAGLAIRDLATGQERPLATPDRVEGRDLKGPVGDGAARNGLTWAANGLIYGPGPANTGVLLHLAGQGA